MKRPQVDRKQSTRAQAIDHALLDILEAAEALWEDVAVLEELGKPQGNKGPEDEAGDLSGYWDAQKRALKGLSSARAEIVGIRHALGRLTERE